MSYLETTYKEKWEHIEIYQSGKKDILSTILQHFENQLPKEVAQYIIVEQKMATENMQEAQERQL